MNRSDVKLRTKLGAAFFAVIALMAVLGGYGMRQLATIDEHMEEIAENSLPGVLKVGQMRLAANRIRRAEADHVLSTADAEKASIEKTIDALKAQLDKLQAAYEPLIGADDERAAYAHYRKQREAYLAALPQSLVSARDGAAAFERARAHFHDRTAGAFDGVADALTAMGDVNMKHADEARDSAREAYAHARAWTLGLILLGVATGVLLAVLIVRSVTRQLGGEPGEAAALARSVAAGNLAAPVALKAGDRTSMMAQLQSMQDGLSKVVADVRRNADSVATASAQIAQGNADLSSRTEEQASALEQTAASMEQLGATVGRNADSAKQANQLALGAASLAARGGDVVRDVVQTMKGIDESSRRIADIIGVIDGIAFQTNILALNAAVEAARAGEQGRGFAVVASEVRSLAQRSAEAAREIKALISTSVQRVAHGNTQVDQAGTTMEEIVAAFRRVADIIGEISAASAEQNAGVAQVGEAVSQMDQATQQNAALVEESAAAAESLRQQAQQLVNTVAVFKLRAEGDAAPATSTPTPRTAPTAAAAARSPTGAVLQRVKALVRKAPVDGEHAWQSF
ncbi:MAG TPA: methyl-accepting chemotaxis protein [Burkholderiaceae bacterium]|nr:methyl-accepting chemotaxis protein [Burkholderiaceae bacterium]